MVKKWGGQEQRVKFIAITIDESYALLTWAIEDLQGDAILIQERGYWELINISANRFKIEDFRFKIEDFENADVPLEIAQRLLRLHHQKVKY